MPKFIVDDNVFIADSNRGTISYDDAVSHVVAEYISAIEGLTWDLVDDIEYLAKEEAIDPTEDGDEDNDGC